MVAGWGEDLVLEPGSKINDPRRRFFETDSQAKWSFMNSRWFSFCTNVESIGGEMDISVI